MSDLGHYGPAAAVGLYGMHYLWQTLSHPPLPAPASTPPLPSSRQRQQAAEALAYFVVGFVLFLAIGYVIVLECPYRRHHMEQHCRTENTMHLLLGVLLMLASLLQVAWMSPLLSAYPDMTMLLVFSSFGFMFYGHHQDSLQEQFVHQVLGISLFLSGLLKTLADEYPRMRLVASILLLFSAVMVIFGSPSVGNFLVHASVSPHNAISIAVACTLSMVLMVICTKFMCSQKSLSLHPLAFFSHVSYYYRARK